MGREQARWLSHLHGTSVPRHTCWESLIQGRHMDFSSAFAPNALEPPPPIPQRWFGSEWPQRAAGQGDSGRLHL